MRTRANAYRKKMTIELVTIHIMMGEIVGLAALWIIAEIWEPTASRVNRAAKIAWAIAIFAWLAYLVGGYYYVAYYRPLGIRDTILKGPWPWGHAIFMEAKEHIFLIGPYIATSLALLIHMTKDKITSDSRIRKAIIVGAVVTIAGVALMLFMGIQISDAYRAGLGGKV